MAELLGSKVPALEPLHTVGVLLPGAPHRPASPPFLLTSLFLFVSQEAPCVLHSLATSRPRQNQVVPGCVPLYSMRHGELFRGRENPVSGWHRLWPHVCGPASKSGCLRRRRAGWWVETAASEPADRSTSPSHLRTVDGRRGWVLGRTEHPSKSYLSYRFQNKRRWLAAWEPQVFRTMVLS